jgi:hypothetical protein
MDDPLAGSSFKPILNENIAKEARFLTDEGRYHYTIDKVFAEHRR